MDFFSVENYARTRGSSITQNAKMRLIFKRGTVFFIFAKISVQ